MVTKEEREQEIKDRKAFKDFPAEHAKKQVAELAQSLSIAERLMRRLKAKTFKLTLQDDLGDIELEVRMMTTSERLLATSLLSKMSTLDEDVESYIKCLEELKQLAKEITLTDGFAEYADSEAVTEDVLLALILTSISGSKQEFGNDINFFRAE